MSAILIVSAVITELKPVLDIVNNIKKAKDFYTGEIEGKEVVLAKLGVGGDNAVSRLEKVLKVIDKPSAIILVGASGGIKKDQRIGDLCKGDKIVHIETKEVIEIESDTKGLHITVDRVAHKEDKKRIAKDFKGIHGREVIGVDMESFYIADYARKKGIPFYLIRAISDSLEGMIPEPIKGISVSLMLSPLNTIKTIVFFNNVRKASNACKEELIKLIKRI